MRAAGNKGDFYICQLQSFGTEPKLVAQKKSDPGLLQIACHWEF